MCNCIPAVLDITFVGLEFKKILWQKNYFNFSADNFRSIFMIRKKFKNKIWGAIRIFKISQ